MSVSWTYTPPSLDGLAVITGAAEAAVEQAAQAVLEESQRLVPVDTGALKDSGRVTRDGLEAVISYGEEDPANTAAYAVAQHERLDFHHPGGGQAKYLETAMNTRGEQVGTILAESIRRAMTG